MTFSLLAMDAVEQVSTKHSDRGTAFYWMCELLFHSTYMSRVNKEGQQLHDEADGIHFQTPTVDTLELNSWARSFGMPLVLVGACVCPNNC